MASSNWRLASAQIGLTTVDTRANFSKKVTADAWAMVLQTIENLMCVCFTEGWLSLLVLNQASNLS